MTNTTTTKTAKTTETLRKGFRAYVGLYGAAYERTLPVFQKAVKRFDDYAVKGEKLETLAGGYAKDARAFATKRYALRTAQLRSFLPATANDRVAELETEIKNLNEKIAKSSKTVATKVAKTVEKTVKAA